MQSLSKIHGHVLTGSAAKPPQSSHRNRFSHDGHRGHRRERQWAGHDWVTAYETDRTAAGCRVQTHLTQQGAELLHGIDDVVAAEWVRECLVDTVHKRAHTDCFPRTSTTTRMRSAPDFVKAEPAAIIGPLNSGRSRPAGGLSASDMLATTRGSMTCR